ncbi:MAG: hypothetical protein ACTSPY_13935 [Candidatus Helarchaeota archaeon]
MKRRNIIIGIIIPFIMLFITLPIVSGNYGSDFSSAVEIYSGTTNDYFRDGEDTGYYKVLCTSMTWLDVSFNCTFSNAMTLTIYDPSQQKVARNTYTGSGFYARITLTCSANGYYYLKVNRSSTSGTLNLTITLDLRVHTTNPIPSFEFVCIFIGTFIAIGIIFYKKHQYLSIKML